MTSNLPVLAGEAGTLTTDLDVALARATDYAKASKAEATRRAYRSDFEDFTAWCTASSLATMPASIETVAAYFAHLADADRSVSTIMRRAAAIAYAHRLAGLEPPTNAEPVKAVLQGIRRSLGVAPKRKAPATAPMLKKMLRSIPDSLIGKRDRAIILIGFAAALRRSELVDIKVNDLERTAEGVFLTIPRSKTDQEGAGHIVPIPRGSKLKPVEALESWLQAAGITEGYVFRPVAKGGRVGAGPIADIGVARIIKHWAQAAGFDAELMSGHSLRSGYVSEALAHGEDLFRIMDQSRHKRVETLRIYDRRAKAFRDHSGRKFL